MITENIKRKKTEINFLFFENPKLTNKEKFFEENYLSPFVLLKEVYRAHFIINKVGKNSFVIVKNKNVIEPKFCFTKILAKEELELELLKNKELDLTNLIIEINKL